MNESQRQACRRNARRDGTVEATLLRLSRIAALSCALVAASVGSANAQDVTTYSPSFDPEQYAHSADPNAISLLDGARPLLKDQFGVGLAFHLGGAPLSACIRNADTGACNGEGSGDVISHRFTSHLVGAFGFGRFDVRAVLPIVLNQGTDFAADAGMNALGSGGITDFNIGGRFLIKKVKEFAFAADLSVSLPLNGGENFIGNSGMTARPRLIGDWRMGKMAAVVSLGYLWRQHNAQLANLFINDEFTWSLGGQYQINPKLSAGLSVFGRVGILSDPDPMKDTGGSPAGEERPAEFLLSGRYWVNNHIAVEGGAGTALSSGYGAANFRIIMGMRWVQRTPPPARLPSAGELEVVTLLPNKDGTVGELEINDGKNSTVLDTAYASTELRGKESVRRVQSSAKLVAAHTTALANILPPPDRDLDDIADAKDACPERPGKASTDPLRNGCPIATEKVVVLPDENGNVGAIEIDDGKTTTLLDQAYSSAEVGSKGGAKKVDAAPASVIKLAMKNVVKLPPADADADGVVDAKDVCPNRAGVASADPLRNGCPPASERIVVLPDADGKVGSIEVDNGTTKTVIDKPYASADVGSDAKVTLAPPSTAPKTVQKAIAGMSTILPVADNDGDGIPDGVDACPSRKGLKSKNSLRNGCPQATETVIVLPNADGTVGSLEVDDGKGNKIVLDKPYATSEVSKTGTASAAPTPPATLIAKKISGISRALPKADSDGDGIVDAHDACKTRPGKINRNTKLHGCPTTVEKIVLLPDADGHVGTIEIGSGAKKVVISEAYATAEIGGDGKAVTTKTKAAAVQKNFRETLEARPDYTSARITIYFNKEAKPTYSVKDQVDDLVADLTGRKGYTVTVVGHTDQTGSARANKRLGRKRAQRVSRQLIRQGVSRRRIKIVSKGESEPAVRIDDPSIPVLKNRRVEIYVKY